MKNLNRKIANSARRAKNRTHWRRDLQNPQREHDRCLERTKMTYQTPGEEPTQRWCAGGRAIQLLIDNDHMLDVNHPDLGGSPAVAWIFANGHGEQTTESYPLDVPAVADVNLSAFHSFYDMMEQLYGMNRDTMNEIERANDQGIPMRNVAAMIPA